MISLLNLKLSSHIPRFTFSVTGNIKSIGLHKETGKFESVSHIELVER